jgi:glycerol uptake facilitator-like aquaporin
MNPTITMAAWIYKLMDFTVRTFIFENHLIWLKIKIKNRFTQTAVIYMCGQFVGATLGYWLTRVIAVDDHLSNPNSFCLTVPNLDIGRSFLIEFIITFLLVLVFCGVVDPRNKKNNGKLLTQMHQNIFCL